MAQAKLQDFAGRIFTLLKDIEFSGYVCELDYDWNENPVEDWYSCCPSCGSQYGHREDCKLTALMKEAKAIIKGGE